MDTINLHSLVLMVGPSGSGKSTLAARYFPAHEIVSSDNIRAELLGDFRIQTNQEDVWAEVHRRVRHRLAFGQRVVVDATNLRHRDRKAFIDMAKHFAVELVYLVVNRPVSEKLKTAGWRAEVRGLIEKHEDLFNANLKAIKAGDGVARVICYDMGRVLRVIGSQQHLTVKDNQPLMVIGDVHGNLNDLDKMLNEATKTGAHVLFLGDIVDYGMHNLATVDTVYDWVRTGRAHMVWGNHERKLDRWIDAGFGKEFRGVIGPGLSITVDEINRSVAANSAFKDRFLAKWRCLSLNSRQHYVLGDYLFTHGAATPEMWNQGGKHTLPGEMGNMAFFGEVDLDKPVRDDGMPNRTYRWIDQIASGKTVVVGHDPRNKETPLVVTNSVGGRAIFLDTGSSKGGKLSCLMIEEF